MLAQLRIGLGLGYRYNLLTIMTLLYADIALPLSY